MPGPKRNGADKRAMLARAYHLRTGERIRRWLSLFSRDFHTSALFGLNHWEARDWASCGWRLMTPIAHIESGPMYWAYQQVVAQATAVKRALLVRTLVFDSEQLTLDATYKDFKGSCGVQALFSFGKRFGVLEGDEQPVAHAVLESTSSAIYRSRFWWK